MSEPIGMEHLDDMKADKELAGGRYDSDVASISGYEPAAQRSSAYTPGVTGGADALESESSRPLPLKTSSIAGPVFNFMNYQIGAGILGLAFAFACAGLAGGLFLLILIGLMTLASFLYLLKCAEISKQYSLERLGFHSGGKVFAVVVNLFIIIDSFGPLSAYLTVGADVVLRFVEPVVTDPSNPIRSRPLIIFLILVFIVLPLSLLRSIRLLEFTSAVSIIPIVYLIGVQIYYISVSPPLNTAAITAFGSNFFYAFPIMVFAFSSQQALFPIYRDLRSTGHGKSSILAVSYLALAISAVFYGISGILGYLQFPTSAKGNLLSNLPQSVATDILFVAMAVSVLFSVPVVLFPARENLDRLLFPRHHAPNSPTGLYTKAAYLRFVLLTVGILLVAYTVAATLPSLAGILSLFGSVTSTAIAFVFPAVFYLRISPIRFKEDPVAWGAIALGTAGAICGLASSALTLYTLIKTSGEEGV